jgi:hypothetical protein
MWMVLIFYQQLCGESEMSTVSFANKLSHAHVLKPNARLWQRAKFLKPKKRRVNEIKTRRPLMTERMLMMTRTTYITSSDTVHATEPWTHDPKGTRIIGRTFKVILLTEEKGHEGIWAKVERYLLFEKKFHMLEFKFASPTGVWVYEFSSVEEVYVAIKDSSDSVIPTNALALLSRPIDMSL